MRQITVGIGTRDTMVSNLIETIDNLEAIECTELDETALACELIGAKLRTEMQAMSSRGLLLLAKTILDHATSTRMG